MPSFAVAMPAPETHLFEVEMEIPARPEPSGALHLALPAWTPGSYAIRDYARHVRDLEVVSPDGRPVPVRKVEKGRWRVASHGHEPLTVRYRVYANELTVRTSHLDATHGYGNGACLFLMAEGRQAEEHVVRFVLPAGWKVSIALPEREGAHVAADYDELVDSPFECGTHRVYDFDVHGVPHTLALWGHGNEDADRLVGDLTRLVEEAARFFGGLPYARYLFLLHVAEGARGGLEHRASQSCGVGPWAFRPEKAYRDTLLLLSHELFHAWNVKRIRPAALGAIDYAKEVPFRDLWALEGFTSYYEGILLTRAGLVPTKHVFGEWAKALKDHLDAPGRRLQSAEDASFDAWIRLYKPDENSPNVSESYYRRGMLLGVALDLTLRAATGGEGSLDDVVLKLWERHGSRDEPYPDDAWETTAAEVGGEGLASFFDRFVRGCETPDFGELLRHAGLLLEEKPEKGEDDEEEVTGLRADFGWKTSRDGARLKVVESYAGRPAYAAGIGAGDELVAVDGVAADQDHLARVERQVPPGSRVTVHLFRRARLLEVPLVLGARRAFTYEIRPDPAASETARALHAAWLGVALPQPPAP